MSDIMLSFGPNAVVLAEGVTDEGVEFIDGYTGAIFDVVDSGRIGIHGDDVPKLKREAQERGLSVETV